VLRSPPAGAEIKARAVMDIGAIWSALCTSSEESANILVNVMGIGERLLSGLKLRWSVMGGKKRCTRFLG